MLQNFNLLEEIKYAVLCEYYKINFDSQRIDLLSGYFEYVRNSDNENVKAYEYWVSGVDNNQTEEKEITTNIIEFPAFYPSGNRVPQHVPERIPAICGEGVFESSEFLYSSNNPGFYNNATERK